MASCQPSGRAGIELELCILLPKPAKKNGLTRKDMKKKQEKNGKKKPVKCAWQVTASHQTSRARQKFIGEEDRPMAPQIWVCTMNVLEPVSAILMEPGGPMPPSNIPPGWFTFSPQALKLTWILRVNSTLHTFEMGVLRLMLLSRCHEIQFLFYKDEGYTVSPLIPHPITWFIFSKALHRTI